MLQGTDPGQCSRARFPCSCSRAVPPGPDAPAGAPGQCSQAEPASGQHGTPFQSAQFIVLIASLASLPLLWLWWTFLVAAPPPTFFIPFQERQSTVKILALPICAGELGSLGEGGTSISSPLVPPHHTGISLCGAAAWKMGHSWLGPVSCPRAAWPPCWPQALFWHQNWYRLMDKLSKPLPSPSLAVYTSCNKAHGLGETSTKRGFHKKI